MALDPTETYCVIGTNQGHIQVCRFPDVEVIRNLEGHTRSVESIVFSRSGKLLATGSTDRVVRIWRRVCESLSLALTELPGPVKSVRLDDGGETLARNQAYDGRLA